MDTAKSKAVIGFAERRSYDLGGVKIEFGALRQGFGLVQLTVMDGADFATAKRVLITATATAENTGMQWTSERKESVGKNWGKAPSLVEGVPAKITLPAGAKLKAWALDDRGQRRAEVPVDDGISRSARSSRRCGTSWRRSRPGVRIAESSIKLPP